MCALLGMAFSKPIVAGFSIREFASWGEDNADGWGLAWYPDNSAAVVKEPISWRSSSHTGFLEGYHNLQSRLYIAHVRHRTTGREPTHADTHPFVRELAGKEYCFAHNGTLQNYQASLPLGQFQPLGSTDSEYLFCHLLEELARQEKNLDEEAGWRWLHARLLDVNGLGKLNCLLTDGQRLFCYHDRAGFKSLTYCQVYILGQGAHHFEDPTVQIDLEGEPLNHGFVVATQPLSSKGWKVLAPGELLVLEKERPAIHFTACQHLAPLPQRDAQANAF